VSDTGPMGLLLLIIFIDLLKHNLFTLILLNCFITIKHTIFLFKLLIKWKINNLLCHNLNP